MRINSTIRLYMDEMVDMNIDRKRKEEEEEKEEKEKRLLTINL